MGSLQLAEPCQSVISLVILLACPLMVFVMTALHGAVQGARQTLSMLTLLSGGDLCCSWQHQSLHLADRGPRRALRLARRLDWIGSCPTAGCFGDLGSGDAGLGFIPRNGFPGDCPHFSLPISWAVRSTGPASSPGYSASLLFLDRFSMSHSCCRWGCWHGDLGWRSS